MMPFLCPGLCIVRDVLVLVPVADHPDQPETIGKISLWPLSELKHVRLSSEVSFSYYIFNIDYMKKKMSLKPSKMMHQCTQLFL